MFDSFDVHSRRAFLGQLGRGAAATGLLLAGGGSLGALAAQKRRPRVGVVFTSFTYRSHAHVLLENFLEPYLFNGKLTDPGVDVVSLYADQQPSGDMAPGVAADYKIPIFKTIGEALTLGGDELAVDAVLSIGEHGNYRVNDLGQREYPRKRFFDEIVAVIRNSKRPVPVFSDKHLSYRWDWAKEMYDTAGALKIPFMAGSSVPLAQRRPPLELPADAQIEEAISIHGGPAESYDFHGLEVLQSMVEARRGGESGVSRVEFVTGDALWKAAEQGRWSRKLANLAMRAELGRKARGWQKMEPAPHALLLEYRDGFRGTVLKVGKMSTRWNFACQLKGEGKPRASAFYVGPWQNRNLFKGLSHAIQHHFQHGKAPYPVERTLLVTGVLEAAMRSRKAGKPVDTPHLEFGYKPVDFRAMREMGASWKIITEQTPEPKGINKDAERVER